MMDFLAILYVVGVCMTLTLLTTSDKPVGLLVPTVALLWPLAMVFGLLALLVIALTQTPDPYDSRE